MEKTKMKAREGKNRVRRLAVVVCLSAAVAIPALSGGMGVCISWNGLPCGNGASQYWGPAQAEGCITGAAYTWGGCSPVFTCEGGVIWGSCSDSGG